MGIDISVSYALKCPFDFFQPFKNENSFLLMGFTKTESRTDLVLRS